MAEQTPEEQLQQEIAQAEEAAWEEEQQRRYEQGLVDQDELGRLQNLQVTFSGEVFTRVVEKFWEGIRGWDDPDFDYDYRDRAIQKIEEGDYVDAAVLVMFLWARSQND